MNILEGGQAGFALVAAAFVTGLWTWIAQKSKNRDDSEEKETYYDIQYRENIVGGYEKLNKALQDRLKEVGDELEKVWSRFREMQVRLDECEKNHVEDIKKIMELELNRVVDVKRILELKSRLDHDG